MKRKLPRHALIGLSAVLLACGDSAPGGLPQGIALGDARPGSLVFWGRCPRHAYLNVNFHHAGKSEPFARAKSRARAKNDHTARIAVRGLQAGQGYGYIAWCAAASNTSDAPVPANAARSEFRMPPAPRIAAPVKFAFGGDIAGQNVCRDARDGFAALRAVRLRKPEFFIALGDLIYADNRCEKKGRFGNEQIPLAAGESVSLEDFRAHWRYNRSDPEYRKLLANTFYFALWDDHEVRNDFGPRDAKGRKAPYPRDLNLMPRGLRAFLEYNPVAAAKAGGSDAPKMYRSFTWGRNLEFFILDNRAYREANTKPDTGPRPKTMLGRKQKAWLLKSLRRSGATWKVVVSSVPMSIPTGTDAKTRGRDGWANFRENTGFERELISILDAARKANIRNMLWLTTDVHFAQVLRYRPFPAHGDFVVHEVVTGPLSAGLYPNRDLDPTLRPERLFFHGPANPKSVKTMEQARTWFNFGLVEIDAKGNLTAAVIDANNKKLYELKLAPR